ncbi:unnamed protein product [Amoebophrya sp. A25]|nr:unnamed protein product [Amoebophrya sp. A25]|eukprot:GSA25T00001872001.1
MMLRSTPGQNTASVLGGLAGTGLLVATLVAASSSSTASGVRGGFVGSLTRVYDIATHPSASLAGVAEAVYLSGAALAADAAAGDYLALYLVFSIALYLVEEHLEWRQLGEDKKKTIPPEVFEYGILDKATKDSPETLEKFEKARLYNYEKRLFGMFTSVVNTGFEVFILLLVKPWAWRKAMEHAPFVRTTYANAMASLPMWFRIGAWLPSWLSIAPTQDASASSLSWFGAGASQGASWEREVPEFLLFSLLLHFIGRPLDLIQSLYSDFVLEEKHGFNKKTLGLFFSDLVKSEILSLVFMMLLLPVITFLIHWGGEMFYVYLWSFVQIFGLFMMWFAPTFIMPLFNKYEPIEDKELRGKIEALAASLKFPLYNLFQMDGSTRSAHSNAFFFGMWRYKRIVLYDTLLHLPHDSILAILGHELGHWKMGHTTWNMLLGSVQLFLSFKLVGTVLYSPAKDAIFASFGMEEASHSVMVAIMLIGLLMEPMDSLLERFTTCLTRVFEFQADAFAVDIGRAEGLKDGLKALAAENKSGYNDDWLWAWYNLDHPTLFERLKAIDKKVAEEGKKSIEMAKKTD